MLHLTDEQMWVMLMVIILCFRIDLLFVHVQRGRGLGLIRMVNDEVKQLV